MNVPFEPKRDFTLEITADNNFSILNRIVNVLNRRRVRIKRLLASEYEGDFRRGVAVILLYTTSEMIEKVKHQLEKLIEVDSALYTEGSELFYELSERNNKLVNS
jgi:acetolactate synthase small subunit